MVITPCSPLKVNRYFGGTCCLHLQGRKIGQARNQREPESKQSFTLVSCLAYSSTLKMEATCSSETSADFQRTTRRYISEDRTVHNHGCENLKSYTFQFPYRSVRVYDFVVYLTTLLVWTGGKELETAKVECNEMAWHSFSFMEKWSAGSKVICGILRTV
jgi:hypothetical protein